MRFTAFTDFAFRVLIYLALEPERRATIGDIAGRYGVSKNHLMKVVNHLTRAGIVSASRGRNGGLLLARPPREVTVGEVVRLTEDNFEIVECFGAHDRCAISPACTLKTVFVESLGAFFDVLDAYSIQDLVKNKTQLEELLRGPC
jgi:Rrf2 family nitric oxide-sensitive transcriptional repressor